MMICSSRYSPAVAITAAMLASAIPGILRAQQTPGAPVTVGNTDIGGVVTGARGPEAGVWVIAYGVGRSAVSAITQTPYAKIVVTDDRGRYLIPDLPQANYSVWVRGYGLVDSPKVQT